MKKNGLRSSNQKFFEPRNWQDFFSSWNVQIKNQKEWVWPACWPQALLKWSWFDVKKGQARQHGVLAHDTADWAEDKTKTRPLPSSKHASCHLSWIITPFQENIAVCIEQELQKVQINDGLRMHAPTYPCIIMLHPQPSFVILHMSLWLIPPCLTTTLKGHNIEKALGILLEILWILAGQWLHVLLWSQPMAFKPCSSQAAISSAEASAKPVNFFGFEGRTEDGRCNTWIYWSQLEKKTWKNMV